MKHSFSTASAMILCLLLFHQAVAQPQRRQPRSSFPQMHLTPFAAQHGQSQGRCEKLLCGLQNVASAQPVAVTTNQPPVSDDSHPAHKEGSGKDKIEQSLAIVERQAAQIQGEGDTGTAVLHWRSEAQKAQCETYLKRLKDNFLQARYSSIQGDSCATAEQAGRFMGLVETCSRECPKGFLQQNGYTERIIRNLNWLHILGRERCLQ